MRYFDILILIAVLRYSLNLRDVFLSVLVDDCRIKMYLSRFAD